MREKPLIKLYKYENNSFSLQAIIDDYAEVTMTHSKYSSGDFSLQINYNIPNALLFEKNLFVQIGENSEDFFCINYVSDEIGEDGKQSQLRTISGKDCRYLFKRRIINSLNNSSNWTQTGKAEDVILALISDQCGSNAETKRKLPISVETSQHRGSDYTITEAFTNLYEVIETITTQAELGWRVVFENGALLLQFYEGTDRHTTVNFSTDFESLRNGTFEDTNESFANAVYVGGKGNNEDRDIYEGENVISGESPNGLDRFEVWDNQSSMTEEEEYENEANSVLAQYGQTVNASGAGMIQCPYIFREEYFVGDIITLAFSGKSAQVQILSVTEHWSCNSYETEFDFGKPIVDLKRQLQLILNKIHSAELEAESRSKDSVKYYTIPTDTQMAKGDVTYSTIGFTGDVGDTNKTFTLYLDTEETGTKTYHVYFKNLTGSGKLILTTGIAGKKTAECKTGTYVNIIYVDAEGNVESYIDKKESRLPTDAVLHYSFDEVPDLPDGTAIYRRDNDFDTTTDWLGNGGVSLSNGKLTFTLGKSQYKYKNITISNKTLKVKIKANTSGMVLWLTVRKPEATSDTILQTFNTISGNEYTYEGVLSDTYWNINFYCTPQGNAGSFDLEQLYIGDGSYNTPIIDNANGQNNATNNGGLATEGVSGKAIKFVSANQYIQNSNNASIIPNSSQDISLSIWVKVSTDYTSESGVYKPVVTTGAYAGTFGFVRSADTIRGIARDSSYWREKTLIMKKGEWVHYVMVYRGNSHRFEMFENGISQGLSDANIANYTFGSNTNYWRIWSNQVVAGTASTTTNQGAEIDDFQIFNRALSEEEVLGLYLSKGNTPKFYSKFDWWLDNQNQPSMASAPLSLSPLSISPIEESEIVEDENIEEENENNLDENNIEE